MIYAIIRKNVSMRLGKPFKNKRNYLVTKDKDLAEQICKAIGKKYKVECVKE